jgi:hypothetical protein
MVDFGSLEIVDKTFTREGGAVRTQSYNGIKFRRYESKKGAKDAAEEGKEFTPFIEEQFIVSKAAWEALGLEELALAQAKGGLLLVLADQDEVKPVAKFLRKSFSKKDGVAQKKGKMFFNEFLVSDLIEAGALKADVKGNQFLKLVDVTAEVSGLPSHVSGVYKLVVDDTISEEDAKAEDAGADESDFK